MSDARLRDLERRVDETDSVEDEAALLEERMRAGEVSGRRVALASFMGDRVAGLVREPAEISSDQRFYQPGQAPQPDIRRVIFHGSLSQREHVLFAVACATRALPVLESCRPSEARPRKNILAALSWANSPSRRSNSLVKHAMRHGIFFLTPDLDRESSAVSSAYFAVNTADTYFDRADALYSGDRDCVESSSYALYAKDPSTRTAELAWQRAYLIRALLATSWPVPTLPARPLVSV